MKELSKEHCKSLFYSMARRLKEFFKNPVKHTKYKVLKKHGRMYMETTSNKLWNHGFQAKTGFFTKYKNLIH